MIAIRLAARTGFQPFPDVGALGRVLLSSSLPTACAASGESGAKPRWRAWPTSAATFCVNPGACLAWEPGHPATPPLAWYSAIFRIRATVRQTVRTLNGAVLAEGVVLLTHVFRGGLIARMDISEPGP